MSELIGIIIFISFSTACVEAFYQTCMQKGMILEFWFRFLKKMELSWHLPKVAKLLGLCPYCNQVYLAIIYYSITFGTIDVYILLCLGIQYLFMYLYLHYIKKH